MPRSRLSLSIWRSGTDGRCRRGAIVPIDLRAFVQELSLDGHVLRIKLRIANEAAARSSDILEVLGLADVLDVGWPMTRTAVELAT